MALLLIVCSAGVHAAAPLPAGLRAAPPLPRRHLAAASQSRLAPLYLADAPSARAFCASPGFKSLKCGWASEAELKATAARQCDGWPLEASDKIRCSTHFKPTPAAGELPATVSGNPNGFIAYRGRALSLACKGPIVTRAVFKLLSAPPGPGAARRAAHLNDWPLDGGAAAGPLIRCELRLVPGPEPEAERALKAKEANCATCTSDSCPQKVGAWYR
jgi:hypothetical protein